MNDTTWYMGMTLEDLEKIVILKCLKLQSNNKTATASCLGIALKTLHNKLDKYEEQANELQRRTEEASTKTEASLRTQGWKPMEPTNEVGAEQSVSVRKREEVQKMPSKLVTSNNPVTTKRA